MLPEDDPRHGSTKGYHAGCHEACCRAAMARYEKAGRLARLNGGRAVPALGAQRRLQALMRLGWSSHRIAAEAGLPHRNHVWRIIHGQKGKPTVWIQRDTDKWVRDVYERLSMQIPDGRYVARTRNYAEARGWLPPLAWDSIDDPNERPKHALASTDRHGHLDMAVVWRLVDEGTRVRNLTAAEAREAYRILVGRGLSTHEIERDYGLNAVRYAKEAA